MPGWRSSALPSIAVSSSVRPLMRSPSTTEGALTLAGSFSASSGVACNCSGADVCASAGAASSVSTASATGRSPAEAAARAGRDASVEKRGLASEACTADGSRMRKRWPGAGGGSLYRIDYP